MENARIVVSIINEVPTQFEVLGNQHPENVGPDQTLTRRRHHGRGLNTNPRDRLFHALFVKVGLIYSQHVPRRLQLALELFVLLEGLALFSLLSYLQFSFSRMPITCLNESVGSWPRDGILRVKIHSALYLLREAPCFYSQQKRSYLFHPCHDTIRFPKSKCRLIKDELRLFYYYNSHKSELNLQCYRLNFSAFLEESEFGHGKEFESYEYIFTDSRGRNFRGYFPGDIVKEDVLSEFYEKYLVKSDASRSYAFEYALESGLLRLSQETRERLKIPVKTVVLHPNRDACFGDGRRRFMLKWLLGYDDLLINSIKMVADSENNTGYMRNLVTGVHYQFGGSWTGRGSFVSSLLLMFVFTISISTLLRICHQQAFFFIADVLRILDWNIAFAFPIAPLVTVILSLVGMETVLSDFFKGTSTSLYVILIVWVADQFDTMCCHTVLSQKYWLRFFFMYHSVFYTYHGRFRGQYSCVALASMWFMTLHSMLFFLHKYELPAIESQGGAGHRAFLGQGVPLLVAGSGTATDPLPGGSREVRTRIQVTTSVPNRLVDAGSVGAAVVRGTGSGDRTPSYYVEAGARNSANAVVAIVPGRPLSVVVRTFFSGLMRSQRLAREGNTRLEEGSSPASGEAATGRGDSLVAGSSAVRETVERHGRLQSLFAAARSVVTSSASNSSARPVAGTDR